jgi:hypothetical protein
MTPTPTNSLRLGETEPLAILLPKAASASLCAVAISLLAARKQQGLPTLVVADSVPESVKLMPEWSLIRDGFNPLEYSHILGLGIETLSESGLFETEPDFGDWPKSALFVNFEVATDYIVWAKKTLEEAHLLTPASATGLFLAFHLTFPELSFIHPHPLYASLVKWGANVAKVFFFLNLPALPVLWWQALRHGHIENGLLEAVIPKDSLENFMLGRVEILELAQTLKEKDPRWIFKFKENSQTVFLELAYA